MARRKIDMHIPENSEQAAVVFAVLQHLEKRLGLLAVAAPAGAIGTTAANGVTERCWIFPNKFQVAFTKSGHGVGVRRGSHHKWMWVWSQSYDNEVEMQCIAWRRIEAMIQGVPEDMVDMTFVPYAGTHLCGANCTNLCRISCPSRHL